MPNIDRDVRCCANCGYLGLRHILTGQIVTAGQDFRETAYIPGLWLRDATLAYEQFPVCFRGAARFRDAQEAGPSWDQARCTAAIQRERDCGEFSKWEGLDPEDHYDMIQESARLQWQSEQADKARRHEHCTLAVSIVAVAVAVVALIASTLIGVWKIPQPITDTIQQSPATTTPNSAPSLPQTSRRTSTADQSLPPSSPE